jgi:hypothetical protein
MLEGKCPNCNLTFYGWVLLNLDKHTCPKCGKLIEVHNEKEAVENNTEIKRAARGDLDTSNAHKSNNDILNNLV